MTTSKKVLFGAIAVFSFSFSIIPTANAMHIMEGYLPVSFCISWGILCIPFLVKGYLTIKKTVSERRKTLIILAMVGAYAFVLSSLKMPSITGSSSHPTGTGLGAILFGPSTMSVLGLIVLLFQAILLAHGGLTTLGANTFSMAVAGPFVSYGIYRLCSKAKQNRSVTVFLSCALGNLFTYCMTSLQLAIAYPAANGSIASSFVKFLGIFAITQIPLAIVEGIISAIVLMTLESYAATELKELGYLKGELPHAESE